jgi:hypothetical protein
MVLPFEFLYSCFWKTKELFFEKVEDEKNNNKAKKTKIFLFTISNFIHTFQLF